MTPTDPGTSSPANDPHAAATPTTPVTDRPASEAPPAAGEPQQDPLVVGAWSALGSPLAASILAGTGADWLVLDAQHGLYDDASLVATLAALAGPSRPERTGRVMVRVPSNDAAWIGRALDAGATGVVVLLVQDEHEALAAARACRYPPDGERSWGGWSGSWGTGTPAPDEANRDVLCAVMVETRSAVDRVDRIAATPGVDMVFVGPYDLALALGMTHPELLADRSPDGPLARVVRACRAAGVRAGAYAGSVEAARLLRAQGFTWVAVLADAALLAEGGAAVVAEARDLG
jgi:4-hydroxy-2-oxoheptanedioate aldolase